MPGQQPPFRLAGVATAAGVLTLAFRGRDSNPVRVTQCSVEMLAGAGSARCSIRLDDALVCPVVAFRDAAVGPPPIWVEPGSVLTAEWTGAVAGSTGVLVVFYDYGEA